MIQWHSTLILRVLGYVADHAIGWGVSALRTWARWFWRLSALAKLAALTAHIIAINIAASLNSADALGLELVELIAVGLVFFVIASLLLGPVRTRNQG